MIFKRKLIAFYSLLANAIVVRWDLPSPIDDKFISVADGAGLIFHKSMWVFQDSVSAISSLII